jgi:Rad3-related DNA helicase
MSVEELKTELEFYKEIRKFPNSLVGNLCVKYMSGKKVWIDITKIDRSILHKLDKDKEVLEWLDGLNNMKYKDRDW